MGARGGSGAGGGSAAKRATRGVEFPPNDSQLKHIFREKHKLTDTAENRQMILETIRKENLLGYNAHGNPYYVRKIDPQTEVWVEVRGTIIQNAGLNIPPNLNWDKTIVKGSNNGQ